MPRSDEAVAEEAFASFVTTYKRPAILKDTIEQLLSQSLPPDYILIIDNAASETDEAAGIAEQFPAGRVGYHPMPTNTGSAGGAAAGLELLFKRGYDWVHWGDDDDPPKTPDLLERLMRLALSASESEPVGVVTAVGSWWDWRRGEFERIPDHALQGTVEIDIAPGGHHPIVSRHAVAVAGLPDARLFFGRIDPEFSLRLRRAGFKILVPGDLYREIRAMDGRLNLDVRRSPVPDRERHEAWREYYGLRNHIHMMRTTFGRPDLAFREAAKAVVKMFASWWKGWRYGAHYTLLIVRAIHDGYRGRLGRRVEPEQKPQPASKTGPPSRSAPPEHHPPEAP